MVILSELKLFKSVKGIGWFIDEYGIAQISYNLTDINISLINEVLQNLSTSNQKRFM